MNFANDKKQALAKIYEFDRSKKGSVDIEIAPLVDAINSLDEYYTTSSCAGRIMVLSTPAGGKKCDCTWLLSSHDMISDKDVVDLKFPESLSFLKLEASILHVCAKDLIAATKLIRIANFSGFKRAGIIAASRRFIIEIMTSEVLAVPIAKEGRLIVSRDYITDIVAIANDMLKNSRKKIKRFEKNLTA